ncbi:hypothetical protein ACLB2K_036047 [Fragaria x ananassa]
MANPHEDAELELLDLAQLEEAPPQLVGYLVSDKALNVATVIRMLRQAWQEIGWTHLETIQAYHTLNHCRECGSCPNLESAVLGQSWGVFLAFTPGHMKHN